MNRQAVNIFWFRRDLRLNDNAGLHHALNSGFPVLCLFIFDSKILDKLEDRDDARVTFIHQAVSSLNKQLAEMGSGVLVKHNTPEAAWKEILAEYNVKNVFANDDYEPYARERDEKLKLLFQSKGVGFHLYKDHVIFEKSEIVKENLSPYTVFTPYKRRWFERLNPDLHLRSYPTTEIHAGNFQKIEPMRIPSLESLGFTDSRLALPGPHYKSVIADYLKTRDFPAIEGTSKLGIHLRFGTVSIREVVREALAATEKTWLSELIWREFYSMILWHFPQTVTQAFKREYDNIRWRNNEEEFQAWCEGRTGYPIVDAGMRQLNATGWMHNRVRMITASFLTKHLLIDWRWGEAYFARMLLDYEQASNVGGWQWAASSGNDAVPYFRIFNPDLQVKRFDPKLEYVKNWVPEFSDPFRYPQPIVDHKEARERALKEFKRALGENNF
ncbi:MAG: deoxyribodipyrimidine photo-lyase [Sphingobacteriaceae bacterium]|jgi:deoxyribodipyrimidine photo-lyase|nr:deoxyribodipyrimidine photo-lyase [Sphingobacteriaceae bacterium]